ncbi:hypothetical protein CRUP_028951 [Coryphaenoides rupestris]|nr:hypothetical protein CRUP_028951 [Coryphaenoides rupestris]
MVCHVLLYLLLLWLLCGYNTVDPSPLFRGHVFENSAAASKVNGLSVPAKRIDAQKRCPDSGFRLKLHGNGSDDFNVVAHHKRGNVFLKTSRVLDRENRAQYLLSLGLWCCQTCAALEVASLKVDVLDTNDHEPTFAHADIRISLPDTTALYTVVCRLDALDADSGKNSELTYTSVPQNGSFYVVPKTGEVLLVDSILGLPSKVVFSVFARDHGWPPLTSQGAVVTVTPHRWAKTPTPGPARWPRALLDAGAPVVSLNVSEDASVGSVVTSLGGGAGAKRFPHAATYELLYPRDSEEGAPVAVGRDSGDVVIARRLDRESEPFVELTVKVQDKRALRIQVFEAVSQH